MTETANVVIVGGGVVGASTAFHLGASGAEDVVLLERRAPAAGSSGKSGALLRAHYTTEAEVRLAVESLRYFADWDQVVGAGSCGYVPTGLVRVVHERNTANLEANVAMLQRLGVDTEIVTASDLAALAGAWNVDDVTLAAYESRGGYADPIATTYGFAERARMLGVDVRLHTPVLRIDPTRASTYRVVTAAGTIETAAVVLAAGAWSRSLLGELGLPVELRTMRIQVAIFRRPPPAGQLHPACIDGINDIWLRIDGRDGECTLVGVIQRDPIDDPDALDEGLDRPYVERARTHVARRMPPMADAVMRGGWAGLVTHSADGRPVIDEHPEHPGLLMFLADSGSSFKTAPAIGGALADWALTGRSSRTDVSAFAARRFADGRPLRGMHEYDDRGHTADRGVMVG